MTSLAGRSESLRFEKERFGKEDMQSRARSKYLEPESGRFVPPLKPACARDKGPDPYARTSTPSGSSKIQASQEAWAASRRRRQRGTHTHSRGRAARSRCDARAARV